MVVNASPPSTRPVARALRRSFASSSDSSRRRHFRELDNIGGFADDLTAVLLIPTLDGAPHAVTAEFVPGVGTVLTEYDSETGVEVDPVEAQTLELSRRSDQPTRTRLQ